MKQKHIRIDKFLLLILIVITINLNAQKEGNIWYFGNNAGIDFNSGTPVALTNGSLNTIEGCSSISDEDGNLLFYTDGVSVWDSTHNMMVNGNGLLGSLTSTQSAIIIKEPGSSNIYSIFTVHWQTGASIGLKYSKVDMNLNSNLGEVTSKNVLMQTNPIEKLTAVKHQNNIDYWIISNSVDTIYTYLYSSAGLSSPLTRATESNLSSVGMYSGYLKASQDGSLLVSVNSGFSIDVYQFNNANGNIDFNFSIPSSPLFYEYGLEFSFDNRFMYITENTSTSTGRLLQFDLQAGTSTDIINSKFIVSNTPETSGALLLAPDDKIYMGRLSSSHLGVINNPNLLQSSCNFVLDGFHLDGKTSEGGLPNYFNSIFVSSSNICAAVDSTVFVCTNNPSDEQEQIDTLKNIFDCDSFYITSTYLVTPIISELIISYTNDLNKVGTMNDTIVGIDGCDSLINIISVILLQMPDAFSPNNDGLNDFFKIPYEGLEIIKFNIYDRWGKIIFEGTDDDKWNGHFKNNWQNIENYFYYIEVKDYYSKEKINFYNKVSLIK